MKFIHLKNDTPALVAENEELLRSYLDVLMMLEDMVAPFSSNRSHRCFTLEYSEKRADTIIQSLVVAKHPEVYENLYKNRSIAARIVKEATHISSVENAHTVETAVDEFIDSLLQAYAMLRNEQKRLASRS